MADSPGASTKQPASEPVDVKSYIGKRIVIHTNNCSGTFCGRLRDVNPVNDLTLTETFLIKGKGINETIGKYVMSQDRIAKICHYGSCNHCP